MAADKDGRIKARLPRGFADRGAADIAATEAMLKEIRKVYELYGYQALETPFIEYTEALGKFLPDQDRPNEGVFSFQDDDEQWLSLRYDLTAPLARHVAEHFDKLPKPYRGYRAGWVFRNEKPGPGRFRQFMQVDADLVGAASPAADAEMAMLMADTLEAVGIQRGDYVIKVNNRKLLDGLMEAVGLSGEENAARRLIVLRALDKRDRLGGDGVRALLGTGRRDESGDFTKGAELDQESIDRILRFVGQPETTIQHLAPVSYEPNRAQRDMQVDPIGGIDFFTNYIDKIQVKRRIVEKTSIGAQGIGEIEKIFEICEDNGYGSRRIVFDTSVIRGLEYYTGTIFEAELTFQITGEDGKPMRFGSVAGGGRYDGLVGRFRGESVPATGFSIGVSRLLAALRARGAVKETPAPGPVVVLALEQEHMADYQRMAGELRAQGIAAEVYLGEGGMNAQLKYADRRGAVCVVIQGSDERERGAVQIKDLILGATLSSAPDRETYLRLQGEARREVPRGDLVAAVAETLARQR